MFLLCKKKLIQMVDPSELTGLTSLQYKNEDSLSSLRLTFFFFDLKNTLMAQLRG